LQPTKTRPPALVTMVNSLVRALAAEARSVRPLMNQVIEFHDSSLTRVTRVASGIEFELEAYVHRSSGHPAVDPGEGWVAE
jgi:hypothetical protein